MEQMVEKFPQLLGSCSLENMEAHREFLVTRVGVSQAKLGQVQYCLLFLYVFY
jgi:hypothetical protein